MALQVWLPLNGDIENQGLNPISMVGSPNSWGNGKIGKCATFSPTSTTPTTKIYNTTTSLNYVNEDFSWSVWINPSSTIYGTSYIFTVGRVDAGGYGYGMSVSSGSVYCWFGNSNWSISITHNVWTHISFCRKGNIIKLYKNGVLDSTQTFSGTLPTYSDGNGLGLGCFHYSGSIYAYNGSMNDFRIYNHCLSPKEVKEISKGLVLHYKMDDGCLKTTNNLVTGLTGGGQCTTSNNVVTISGSNSDTYFYLNTSTALTSGKTYKISCVGHFDNGKYYYFPIGGQSNTSPGQLLVKNGYCSLVFTANSTIQNSGTQIILDDTSRSAGAGTITNITLEEVNGIYDCSGFGYNGTVTSASAPILDSDSPRYSGAFKFDTTAKYITTAIDPAGYKDTYSIAWWGNIPSFGGAMFWGFGNMMNWYDGKYWNQGDGGNNPFYSSGTTTITPPSINTWHHYVITGDGSATKLYVDGVLYGTAKTYRAIGGISLQINGWPNDANYRISGMKMSDYRIYATPLSAEDIKELYNTSAIICDNGTVMAYSLEE